ncbi:cytoplasmic dynein 1 intermediate chain 1 isoform X3 [Tachysurus ichikawai]
MADKSDLKAELERKKQRLAQIREEKKRKEEEKKKKESETQQKIEAAPEDSDLDRKRRETEALLQSIGISPEPPLGTLITLIHSLSILLHRKVTHTTIHPPIHTIIPGTSGLIRKGPVWL